jgi:hypothetical protein
VITILVVFYRLPLKDEGLPDESLSARFDLLHIDYTSIYIFLILKSENHHEVQKSVILSLNELSIGPWMSFPLLVSVSELSTVNRI